jgi:hypothetical protein
VTEIYCFRCEMDKHKKVAPVSSKNGQALKSPPLSELYIQEANKLPLHNIFCEKATREEIQEAGNNHMNMFSKLWIAVQAWITEQEYKIE